MLTLAKQIIFSLMPIKYRFRYIYKTPDRHWNSPESDSGSGSTLLNTINIREHLPPLLNKYGITTIVDVPCGDFNWMSHVVKESPFIREYTGIDIVPELIYRNNKAYGSKNVRFVESNIISDVAPSADMLLMRDCLIHFSFAHARCALQNVKRSESKYFLSTTYSEIEDNADIVTGRWRPINLTKPPYNFPPPIEFIRENEKLGKSVGFWLVSDIPNF